MKEVWVCGRNKGGEFPNISWDLQGVFSSKGLAVVACRDHTYFIGPVEVNKPLPHESGKWIGCYYPIEQK